MTLPASWRSPTVSINAERPSAKWIVARVLSLLGHYYQVETDPAIRQLMLTDWIEDLSDLPQEAVEKAVTEWRRSSGSRPKPGDIRKLALAQIDRPKAQDDTPPPFGPDRDVGPEERERMMTMLSQLSRELAGFEGVKRIPARPEDAE